jgi:hypothetical protein
MACVLISFIAIAAMICMTNIVLATLRTPDYDESWADDREFD